VASDNNSAPDGLRSWLRFGAGAGTNYLVAADGVNGAQGNIKLNWSLGNPPAISQFSTNRVVPQGDGAVFAVVASGSSPLAYQWCFNGAALAGATGPILTVSVVQLAQAGAYSVIVSNFAGVATSGVAVLSVALPLLPVAELRLLPGGFQFTLAGETGRTYVVETSTNLAGWTPWLTVTNLSPPRSLLDAAISNAPQRFYRARPQ
jgi:hypothetical protein